MTAIARRRFTSMLAGSVAAAAVALAAAGAGFAQAPDQATADRVAAFLQQYASARPVIVPVSRGTATVLIVKFTDYQCPACAMTYRTYKPILDKYEAQFPGAVKLVEKDYPLNQDCNPGLIRTLHPASCDAAVAVALAREQKHGPEMEEWLYSNQPLMTPETVRKIAELVGGVKDFAGGYGHAIEQVKADASLGRLLNVNSTPTFFINGVKVDTALLPELFDAAIAYELKKAGKIK